MLLRRGCGMLSAQLPLPGSTERKGFSAMSGVRSTTTYLRGAEGVHEVGRNARAHARARAQAQGPWRHSSERRSGDDREEGGDEETIKKPKKRKSDLLEGNVQ